MRATTTTLHALALAALALPLGLPLAAQDAAPAEDAAPAPGTAATPEAPDAPADADPAATTPAETAPAEAAPEAPATDPAVAPAGDAAPADGAAPDAGLSLGEPVEGAPAGEGAAAQAGTGEPQPGETFIRETFGDWSQRCLQAEDGQPDPCQLYQLLADAEGNAVAEISMFPLPAGGEAVAGATIVTPLETLLTEDLTLSVDGTATRRYPFTFCNAAGCVARVGFTAEEIQQFKNGDQATIRLVPAAAPDQEVVLTISLSGFTAGFDAQQTPPAE